MSSRSVGLLSLLLCSGCDCGSSASSSGRGGDPGCSDVDGDGFGVGRDCTGPDCNDFIPSVHEEAACEEWCAAHPVTPGCACDALEPAPCYTGDPATRGVADCRGGFTTCTGGTWGACDGEILPRDESCNDEDDDCDGETDEGVLGECGVCGDCGSSCAGPDAACAPWGEAREDLVDTPEGWLTLDGTEPEPLHVIWPSSGGSGEVLRVDTRTFDIQGVYWTGPNHEGALGNGDSPSRSGVTDEGDLVIANRAIGGDSRGSITRIAANPDTCPDRDRDGVVETSAGWGDKLAFDSHEVWEDECILWHTVVGDADGVGSIPRAVALHRVAALDGASELRGWIGLYGNQKFVEIDVETGETTGVEAPTPWFSPYGAAADRDGFVWATDPLGLIGPGSVGRFDTSSPEDTFETFVLPPGGFGTRIIVDENDVPWVSGGDVFRYDRDAGAWDTVGLAGLAGVGNIASDGEGSIWAGSGAFSEQCFRIDSETLEFHTIATPGTPTFGAAVDFDGHAWFFGLASGNATVVDIEDETTELVLDDCDGGACLLAPYVRGDITGMQRHIEVDPAGTWSGVFQGCPAETDWKRIVVDALTPAGSEVAIAARTADDAAALAGEEWIELGSVPATEAFDLDPALASDEALLEVRATLHAGAADPPALRRVDVSWGCPAAIE